MEKVEQDTLEFKEGMEMNQYIINSLVECSLHFTTIEAAKQFADKYGFSVCEVYYLDEHSPRFIGYGIENENQLMNGNEFTFL